MKKIKTTFSNKTKVADAKWKIKIFKQGKQNMADFIIKFEALAMKANIDELYAIFLLKKNIWADIIKIILGYLFIAVLETLKKWKIAITSVGQGYESMKGWYNDQTGTETTYGGQGLPMDIGKSNNNFKDGKSKCFNCKVYRHIVWGCKKPKKEKDTWKCYEYRKVGHIAKDCRTKMKKRSVWEERDTDNKEENDKWKGFGKDLE